jgi:hypothetical protein
MLFPSTHYSCIFKFKFRRVQFKCFASLLHATVPHVCHLMLLPSTYFKFSSGGFSSKIRHCWRHAHPTNKTRAPREAWSVHVDAPLLAGGGTARARHLGGVRRAAGPHTTSRTTSNRPISVYRLGEMLIQGCGQSVSAPRGKSGARLNAHTELRAKRQRSAREGIYRNRLILHLLSRDPAVLPQQPQL